MGARLKIFKNQMGYVRFALGKLSVWFGRAGLGSGF